jgi:hypothetical protein
MTMQCPRRHKPVAYLDQVCVAADGPVTLHRAAEGGTIRIFQPSRAAGDALTRERNGSRSCLL